MKKQQLQRQYAYQYVSDSFIDLSAEWKGNFGISGIKVHLLSGQCCVICILPISVSIGYIPLIHPKNVDIVTPKIIYSEHCTPNQTRRSLSLSLSLESVASTRQTTTNEKERPSFLFKYSIAHSFAFTQRERESKERERDAVAAGEGIGMERRGSG